MTVAFVLSRIAAVTAELNLPACGGQPWPLSEMTTFRIRGERVTPEEYLTFLEKMLEERKAK